MSIQHKNKSKVDLTPFLIMVLKYKYVACILGGFEGQDMRYDSRVEYEGI